MLLTCCDTVLFYTILIAFLYYSHACGASCSHDGKTPLLCAAEAGHDELVAYLLQFENVRTDLKEQPEVGKSASVSLINESHKAVVIDG